MNKTTSKIELEKNALIALEEYFGHILNDGSGKPMQISLEEVANDVIGLFRAKTTSTDIEELGEDVERPDNTEAIEHAFDEVIKDLILLREHITGFEDARRYDPKHTAGTVPFAPHLSNKSELKKEAVEGFVRECVEAFKTLTVNPNTSDNEGAVVEGFHYDTALTKMVPDMLIAFKNEYLSSNEKNSKLGGKE